jgi:hypothetical protein
MNTELIHKIAGTISTIIMLVIVIPGACILILSRKTKKILFRGS